MNPDFRRPAACAVAFAAVAFASACAGSACAQEFHWRKHQGKTLTFLANNNPVANALLKYKADFEQQTGMVLKVDSYQEQQMRQRLVTVMNARSDEVDVFMSLPSREGMQFARAGWYANLSDLVRNASAKDYDFADLSAGMLKDATYDQQLSGIPMNVEGPVLYYRKDLFQKCGVTLPKSLPELDAVSAQLKRCVPGVTPFVSRGLRSALPFTYSVFLHNMGGQYLRDGKSQLCSKEGQASLALYAKLLKDYGPPGVVNYNFYQTSSLYKEGRAAMAFESSNELRNLMDGGARLNDTAVAVLPAGPGGSHPTVIGWTMSVSAHSRHKEAAWYFVQWATSPAIQAKLALDGVAPARSAVAKSPGYKAWMDEQPVRAEWVAAVNELSRTGTSEVGYPIVANPASRDFIGQAATELLLGQKTPAQACADADKQLDALIAKD
ncbi:sugar ABC transporter substrate-binding protein [Verminephrobacter aporrectodeae subsp. tuberculatae]|uniref:ABC transporter substrate-binding protein n=1 Tax=Verminephrobacter aporrectodeae TaxID=1110389 RepID=UPI002237E617|nr:sugar ABC transporter substrate-binding protein [Verminephrobacter aporrectodeae]MCW5256604.1 sugar ABC transporter substrate-binding protein [Verminephrobacter aporrectodeae subsp. tuberculatae]